MKALLGNSSAEIPQFLIKSTLGCSLVVISILIPFLINSILHSDYLLTFAVSTIITLCTINAWHGHHGEYHLNLNTYFVSPVGAISVVYALYHLGEVASYWPFLLTLSYYFVLPQQRAVIFNIVTLIVLLPSAWLVLYSEMAARFCVGLIGTNLFAFLSMGEVYALHAQLQDRAIRDHLTGLLNRSTLNESLQQAIAQHQRTNMPMTILSFDIDYFKTINDTLGHAEGDKVLVKLSDILKQRTREVDSVFRTGGEEFLLLAYNTTQKQGAEIAESLRLQVENTLFVNNKPVTLSFGVTELHIDMTDTQWMKDCDEKLYLAKRNGRNQVVV